VQVGRRAGWIVLTISNYDLNFVTGVTHSRNHEIISLFARCYMEIASKSLTSVGPNQNVAEP
jgi:hypothetical protein